MSLQITVHEPKVSTESSLRTIALDLVSCCIPKANVNVKTAGKPSGIAATASETAVKNVSTIGIPLNNSKMNINTQTIMAITESVFPSLSIFF